MIRLLERAAGASPAQPAVVTPEGTASYGELLAGARAIGATLRHRGIERFAVVEPDAGMVIRLLAGAAVAGAEPCQYEADIAPGELARQAAALGHEVLVTRRADLERVADAISPDQLLDGAGESITPAAAQPLMIRTSGTTGTPKAARHDWRRLERTVRDVEPRPEQRWLLAYGPHQFAGIQVLQHVIASRATLVAPFPRQPRDGLRALLDDDVTCVSATPTYWRFLLAEARSASAALPPLQQVTLGGEASPSDLLEQLRRTFPGARISHVYASTEFGSVASVRDGHPGLPVAALESDANPGARLRVIDGQLWVRAEAGMLGYADGSAATADESTADESVDDESTADEEWRATGDLVEIVGDRVMFRGRAAEVVNVGGVKVSPLPIEDRITGLERVALARVFGRPNPLTGAIVAAEVVPAAGVGEAEHEDIRQEIRAAVADLPRAWHPRSVTFVEAIETRGSKTVRAARA